MHADFLPADPKARRLALIVWGVAAVAGTVAVWWLSSYLEALTELARTDRAASLALFRSRVLPALMAVVLVAVVCGALAAETRPGDPAHEQLRQADRRVHGVRGVSHGGSTADRAVDCFVDVEIGVGVIRSLAPDLKVGPTAVTWPAFSASVATAGENRSEDQQLAGDRGQVLTPERGTLPVPARDRHEDVEARFVVLAAERPEGHDPDRCRGVRAQPVEQDVGSVRQRAGERGLGASHGLAWPHDEGGETDEDGSADAVCGPAVRVEQEIDVGEDAECAEEGRLPAPGGLRPERGRPCTSQPAARPASACPTGDGIRSEDYPEVRRNRTAAARAGADVSAYPRCPEAKVHELRNLLTDKHIMARHSQIFA